MSEDDEGDETKANCEVDVERTYVGIGLRRFVRNIGVVEIKAALSRSDMLSDGRGRKIAICEDD